MFYFIIHYFIIQPKKIDITSRLLFQSKSKESDDNPLLPPCLLNVGTGGSAAGGGGAIGTQGTIFTCTTCSTSLAEPPRLTNATSLQSPAFQAAGMVLT